MQQRGTEGVCGAPSIQQGPGPCFRVRSIEVILKVLLDMSDPVWCLKILSSELVVTYVKVYEYYHYLKDIFGLSLTSSVTNATDQSKIKLGSFYLYTYVRFRKWLKSKQKKHLEALAMKGLKFLNTLLRKVVHSLHGYYFLFTLFYLEWSILYLTWIKCHRTSGLTLSQPGI